MDKMNVDTQYLNHILDFFKDHSATAFTNLHPTATSILFSLAVIEFLITWSFYFDGMKLQAIVQKIMKIGAFVVLVNYWDKISMSIFIFLGNAGLTAAGLNALADTKLGPSDIMNLGLNAVTKILEATNKMGMTELGKCIFLYILAGLLVIAFAWISLQLLITMVEFYVTSSLATILLPFGMIPQTSFLWQRSISAVFAFAVKAMVMFFMIGLMYTYLHDLAKAFSDVKESYSSINTSYLANALNVMVLAYLTTKIPELAASMISGSPQLSAGGFMQTIRTGGAMAATAVGAGAGFALGRAAVAGSAISKAATAYQTGQTNLGGAAITALKSGAGMEASAIWTNIKGRTPTLALAASNSQSLGQFLSNAANYKYQRNVSKLSGAEKILNANQDLNQYNSLKNILENGPQAHVQGPDISYQN